MTSRRWWREGAPVCWSFIYIYFFFLQFWGSIILCIYSSKIKTTPLQTYLHFLGLFTSFQNFPTVFIHVQHPQVSYHTASTLTDHWRAAECFPLVVSLRATTDCFYQSPSPTLLEIMGNILGWLKDHTFFFSFTLNIKTLNSQIKKDLMFAQWQYPFFLSVYLSW